MYVPHDAFVQDVHGMAWLERFVKCVVIPTYTEHKHPKHVHFI